MKPDRVEVFFLLDGRIIPFHTVCRDNAVEIWIYGQRYVIDLDTPVSGKRAVVRDLRVRDQIIADMPGTILKINVKRGQLFKANAPLIVMESMKMEMTLTAPHPGRIREIGCKVGQMVEVGAVLVRIEPLSTNEKK